MQYLKKKVNNPHCKVSGVKLNGVSERPLQLLLIRRCLYMIRCCSAVPALSDLILVGGSLAGEDFEVVKERPSFHAWTEGLFPCVGLMSGFYWTVESPAPL